MLGVRLHIFSRTWASAGTQYGLTGAAREVLVPAARLVAYYLQRGLVQGHYQPHIPADCRCESLPGHGHSRGILSFVVGNRPDQGEIGRIP
jgi:hypothetical protein